MTLDTPVAVLRALGKHMARLQAEETIRLANAVGLGSGTLKKEAARDLTSALSKQTRSRGRATGASIASLGFELVTDR